MKLVHRNLVHNGPGSVKLVPGEEDDLWHAYNLIAIGDNLQAVTVRKVLREVASGGRDAERVKLKLEIVVESVDYDKEGSVLRVRGKNITKNDHVKEIWDWLALETIQQACDPAASADLAVILMQEGLAHLFLIGRRKLAAAVNTKDHTGFVGHYPVTRKFAATLANQPTISHLVKVITDIQIFASLIVSVVCFCKVFHYGIIQLRTDV
ncbi:protein PELOTA 1-like [Miscanthus floridulus]|uniref:protein PELOTA 1-like n=1 Tax=Miscanthus floridulus TaxID=154761 RepID=UPI0034597D14